MQRKKYLFSNDLNKEAKILGIIKIGFGILCLAVLIYHVCIYITNPGPSFEKLKLKSSEEQPKDENPVANFLVWGADRRTLMLILPYLDCIGFSGFILLWAAHRRMAELFQLWIISAIVFCMVDMILIIPTVSYAHDKILVLATYALSSFRKLYAFWIVKDILGGLRAEAEAQDDMDFEPSTFKKY